MPMTTRRAVLAAALVITAFASLSCGSGTSSTTTQPTTPALPTIYEAGTPGLTNPTVITEVKPQYTSAALVARIQGTVLVAAVVLKDGTVADTTVIRSLDTVYGLDSQALSAAKQWLFSPGMKDGIPVAVRVTIEFTFTLR